MKKFMKRFLTIMFLLAVFFPHQATGMTIGYYDNSRELLDLETYLSNAMQALIDMGHTLVTTNFADATFLSSVDAFYTGLITSVSAAEVSAMQDFVNVQGGFLFVQTDHSYSSPWTAPTNDILSSWGISVDGSYSNDLNHYTLGVSDWVTNPNDVDNFIGNAHSAITSYSPGFEVLGRDDQDRDILGVYDAGAGRSSDVLIATDINFWDDYFGWSNSGNRDLWENIWTSASQQIEPVEPVPEPATMLLLGTGLLGLAGFRRRFRKR